MVAHMSKNKTIRKPSWSVRGSDEGRIIMDELKDYLNRLEPGPVEETTHLERLLAKVWDDLGGDNGGMTGHKLIGRMEARPVEPALADLRDRTPRRDRPRLDQGRTPAMDCRSRPPDSDVPAYWAPAVVADGKTGRCWFHRRSDRKQDRRWRSGRPAHLAQRWACPGGDGQDLPRSVRIQADRPGTKTAAEGSLDRETQPERLGSSR